MTSDVSRVVVAQRGDQTDPTTHPSHVVHSLLRLMNEHFILRFHNRFCKQNNKNIDYLKIVGHVEIIRVFNFHFAINNKIFNKILIFLFEANAIHIPVLSLHY